jgi:hypothetical protein
LVQADKRKEQKEERKKKDDHFTFIRKELYRNSVKKTIQMNNGK